MKQLIRALVVAVVVALGTAWAADQTCCEKAAEAGKACRKKCCLAAHKEGKSCERCNPQKQDLKLLKKGAKKAAAKSAQAGDKK
jgi:hypothetical protein